jgi:hypothetical protein
MARDVGSVLMIMHDLRYACLSPNLRNVECSDNNTLTYML